MNLLALLEISDNPPLGTIHLKPSVIQFELSAASAAIAGLFAIPSGKQAFDVIEHQAVIVGLG